MSSLFARFGVLLGALVVTSLGCSSSDKPSLAGVTGTLTKDGKPFADALVEFYPEADGGASYGTTDEQGNFKLSYSTGDSGAAIGMHVVKVIGGRVVGGKAAAPSKMASNEDGEEFAVLTDPSAPVRRSAGPPEPVVLSAEVLADQDNMITLVMP